MHMESYTKWFIGTATVIVLALLVLISLWILFRSPAQQRLADSLAERVESEVGLYRVQEWGLEVLSRYEDGRIGVTDDCTHAYWSHQVRVTESEVLQFVTETWPTRPGTEPPFHMSPEVLIVTSGENQPQFLAVAWYGLGLMIGPPQFSDSIDENEYWYLRELTSGVYVYVFVK